jgi:hypothetical protein
MEVVSFGQVLNAFGDPMVCVGFHWLRVKEHDAAGMGRFDIAVDCWREMRVQEGVDLKRINNEYQEKKGNGKGNGKEKQETKIINQKPVEDSEIDEDEIIDVNLYDQLNREWNKFKWYSLPSIAKKLGKHRKTVVYWRDFGIKINGSPIRLKMAKRPIQWYSKGKWLIEFFLKTNADVEMDGN